jgi:hypothetical protein
MVEQRSSKSFVWVRFLLSLLFSKKNVFRNNNNNIVNFYKIHKLITSGRRYRNRNFFTKSVGKNFFFLKFSKKTKPIIFFNYIKNANLGKYYYLSKFFYLKKKNLTLTSSSFSFAYFNFIPNKSFSSFLINFTRSFRVNPFIDLIFSSKTFTYFFYLFFYTNSYIFLKNIKITLNHTFFFSKSFTCSNENNNNY